jgi:endonuclease/exonuclease/phosphatase family metal-dependent hydrolase
MVQAGDCIHACFRETRLCQLDVRIHGKAYRFLSVYFPDSSYPDAEVQKLYDLLDEARNDARKKRYRCVIAGDFNAKVGAHLDNDGHSAAGKHGYGTQNSRGQWLLTWASVNSFKIANTCFRKQDAKLVTHIGTRGQQSQLDYILVDTWTRAKLQDVEAGGWIDLGSDHLCLQAVLNFERRSRKSGKKKAPTQ